MGTVNAVSFSPQLTVPNAGTARNSERQDFTYFDVETSSCVPIDDALARHQGLAPKFMPTGHSEAEKEVWAASRA
jgi:hypothetical protein